MTGSMVAEVAFNLPLERAFHYLIPAALQDVLQPGMRVVAPFGPRERVGCVVRLVDKSPIRQLKVIRRLVDPVPMVADERWALASWLSSHYCCSLGEALFLMVPSALRLPRRPAADPLAEPPPQPVAAAAPRLSPDQQRALNAVLGILNASTFQQMLLHGVTASGKTELYLRAIGHVLAQGRGAICLVPEIAITPQMIDRFRERLGPRVALWHSRLTARERAVAWSRLANGACRVVVGARSAVFAPVQRLGLIVLDEEHEPTYKQEETPRYHARDVALVRARLTGAAVVLGSATPSIESYYAATQPGNRLVTLPERVEGRPLPTVEIIDMRSELGRRQRTGPLSARLQRELQRTLEQGEQAMLLLNRRGFARTAQCNACGEVRRCDRCSVPLVYHASRQALVCHYCNASEAPGDVCDRCRKGYLRFRGSGTERVESELHRLFPGSSIARLDRDASRRRDVPRQIYEAFKTHATSILVGTQMIAKGFDFPQVTLVGVVSADTALNLPDFRAGERTFDLLTQVAGRAGRGGRPGRVVIQTYCPDHYAIQAAKGHDYRRFYQEELRTRRRLDLPPFTRLIELTVTGSSRQRVEEAAGRLAAALRRASRRSSLSAGPSTGQAGRQGVALLGPAPHRIPRLRRRYRTLLLLKGRTLEPMVELVRKVLQPGRRFEGLPVAVDVDPL
jgi:primosomal protein N' (replication factor Y)